MKNRLFAFLVMSVLALSLAACGQAPGPADTPVDDAAPVEENVQNPVMNFIGVYHAGEDDSLEARVEAQGSEEARSIVTCAGSPWFHEQTVMSGSFDAGTLTVAFDNATLTEYTYNSDGSVGEEKLSYTDGKGRAVFNYEDSTLTITEENGFGDRETLFARGPASGMKFVTDPFHYASVTAMDKYEVEAVVGYHVRTAYLSENWYAIADMIRYPITINGTKLPDSVAFIDYMQDKTISESDRQAMLEEDFLDMFVNMQGICMGDGEIWLSDPNCMTDGEPVLEIIAINGIVSRTTGRDPSGAETETARKDGERFEAIIVLEGMEETVRYEHIRNDVIGFEMDYDYENFVRHSEADREFFISDWDDPEHPENCFEVTHSPEDADAVAASIAGELSKEYDILTDLRMLEHAGECIRIEASELKGTGRMADRLQVVYIIRASDGCCIVAARFSAEGAEGIGRRFDYMMHTLSLTA